MSKLPFTIAANAKFGFRANAPLAVTPQTKFSFKSVLLTAVVGAFALGAGIAHADAAEIDNGKYDLVLYSGSNAYVLDTGMTAYDCNEVPVAAYVNEFGATVAIKVTDILRCEVSSDAD